MKIALVLYPIQDLGGIITHVENLAYGLRELGHDVYFHILCWQDSFKSLTYSDKDLRKRGWSFGAFCAVHPQNGWNAVPYKHKLTYKGKENLKKTRDILSSYDLIIWEVPVPSKSKLNSGNSDWIKLYDACDNNIAIMHDGNLYNTPWICEVRKNFKGLACVHECSFNLSKSLDVPRALILNPQDLSGVSETYNYYKRDRGFLSLQIFKAWKHVDQLIRSIPYLSKGIRKVMAGGGIEQRYMVSRYKTKEKYFCRVADDPDLSLDIELNKVKIWDRALYNGMEWLGFISEFRRDVLLFQLRTLIDPSWSMRYSAHGGHFNRTIVEAIKRGCIPIATNLGMSNNVEGEGIIFHPKDNYIMIPHNSTPKDYAGIIEYANSLSLDESNRIIENNYNLLDFFDRRKVAEDFINLSCGRKCGFLNGRKLGKLDPVLLESSDDEIENFFKFK